MVMGAIYRWHVYAAVLLAALGTVLAAVVTALDDVTQAEFAAASAKTATVAEPALPLYTVVVAAALAGIVYMFSSLIVRVNEGD